VVDRPQPTCNTRCHGAGTRRGHTERPAPLGAPAGVWNAATSRLLRGPPLSAGRLGRDATATRPATFGQVFAVAEFRPLFGSYLLSTIGDELARVALTVLVYQRTASPVLSAITFAISYLPYLLGGPVLGALADRFPRHRVLIASDVARAVLVAGMAVPGMPLPVLLALLLAVSLCSPPFEAARSALMADVLHGDRYAVGISIVGITSQLAQLTAFLLGGALLLAFSPSAALLIDAAAFAVSAGWLTLGLRRRPAPIAELDDGELRTIWRDTVSGVRFLTSTPRLQATVGLLWVTALFVNAPEGIAAPFGVQLHGTAAATGLLLAAGPAGTALGGLLVGRLCPPHLRQRLLTPLITLALGGVLAAGLAPLWLGIGTGAFTVVLVLLFLAGIGGACSIPLNVSVVQAVPSAYRGRAFGVAAAGLAGVQGLGVLGAGLGAEVFRPSTVVALSGGIGLLAVVGPLLMFRRTRPPAGGDPAHVAAAPQAEGRSMT
jgi:MFS family permease